MPLASFSFQPDSTELVGLFILFACFHDASVHRMIQLGNRQREAMRVHPRLHR
jgi:hypothetical protein